MSVFSMREDIEMRSEEVTLASGATTFLFHTSGGNYETRALLCEGGSTSGRGSIEGLPTPVTLGAADA